MRVSVSFTSLLSVFVSKFFKIWSVVRVKQTSFYKLKDEKMT